MCPHYKNASIRKPIRQSNTPRSSPKRPLKEECRQFQRLSMGEGILRNTPAIYDKTISGWLKNYQRQYKEKHNALTLNASPSLRRLNTNGLSLSGS